MPRLDVCLLTDNEIQHAVSVWASYSDPSPSWDEAFFTDVDTD